MISQTLLEKKSICTFEATEQYSLSFFNTVGEISPSTNLFLCNFLQKYTSQLRKQGYIISSFLDETTARLCFYVVHESGQENVQISSEIIRPYLPIQAEVSGFSFHKTQFLIEQFPEKRYWYYEIIFSIDTVESFLFIKKSIQEIERLIAGALFFPTWFHHITNCPGIDSSMLLSKAYEEFSLWNKLFHKKMPASDFLDEMYRFCMATNFEFKTMRTMRHLVRLVASHYVMKKQFGEQHLYTDDRLSVRIIPSKIQFLFGEKHAISIIVCLKKMYKNEQFDHRHILQACKRVLPSLVGVPRSYYSYRYPSDPAIAFHIECEKTSEEKCTVSELSLLKKLLPKELQGSIEHVMSRMDIPSNEEELFRNMIVLLDQITSKNDPPHVLVSFQSQTSTCLKFHVTIVRPVLAETEKTEEIPDLSDKFCHSILLKSYRGKQFVKKYHKQGLMFLLECTKEAFLRKDRSIDFRKARSAVVSCVESNFGKVRDLNGGLLHQQHSLLQSITPMLTEEEHIHHAVIEDLFSSIFPGLMKNFVSPEEVLAVFRMFLQCKEQLLDVSGDTLLIEEKGSFLILGCIRPDSVTVEDLYKISSKIPLHEQAFAIFSIPLGSYNFSVLLAKTTSDTKKHHCISHTKKLLQERQTCLLKLPVKIGLPYLSQHLDPRTLYDHSSQNLIRFLYEGLVTQDREGNIYKAIADSYQVSEDGTIYRFVLKKTYWSNGTALTAHDFIYGWKKIVDPAFQTPFAFLLFPIKNGMQIKDGTLSADTLGVYPIHDNILEIHLERPHVEFLSYLAHPALSPIPHMIDSKKPGWAFYQDRSYICNGPFMIKKRKHDKQLLLIKNELYWNSAHVQIPQLDICALENTKQAVKLYQQHRLDIIGMPFSESITRHDHAGCPWSYAKKSTRLSVHCTTQNLLLSSKKIRKALLLAANRNGILSSILKSQGSIPKTIIPGGSCIYHELGEYAPKQAKKYFDEGILELKLPKSKKRNLLMRVCDKETEIQIAEELVSNWSSALPLTFTLQIVPESKLFDRCSIQQPDLFLSCWFSYAKDPFCMLESLCLTTNLCNIGMYQNEEIVHLIRQKSCTASSGYKAVLQEEIERLLIEDLPLIPICDYDSFVAYKEPFSYLL